jgi:hypothetical protein
MLGRLKYVSTEEANFFHIVASVVCTQNKADEASIIKMNRRRRFFKQFDARGGFGFAESMMPPSKANAADDGGVTVVVPSIIPSKRILLLLLL